MAEDSQRLLSSPALDKFFSEIERKCFARADELPLGDTAGRDRAYMIIHMSRKLKATLEYYIQNGEASKQQLDELMGANKKPSLLGRIFDV